MPPVVKALLHPELTPRMVWNLTMAGFIGYLFLYSLWGFGMFASLGFPGYARADKLDAIEAKQDIALKLQLAPEICRLHYLRMEATNLDLWSQLTQQFEQRQVEYQAVNKGNRYPTSDCSTAPGRR